MTRHRVAITGIGCLAATGSASEFWPSVRSGHPALAPVETRNGDRPAVPAAGSIPAFDPLAYMERRIVGQTDRHSQLGLAAAQLALDDAGLSADAVNRARVGVVLANNLGGSGFGEQQLARLHGDKRPVSPYMAIAWFYAATIGQVSIRHGFTGYCKAHAAERVGAHVALGDALRVIQRGDLDVCLAGGCEAPLSPYALLGYREAGVLSPTGAYRPYSRHRDGAVIGEAGAVLALEAWDHARARGTPIYAELLGYGGTCDGVHHRDGAPDGHQYARAMRLALEDACLEAADVGVVLGDASGGRELDVREARAIRLAFSGDVDHLLVAVPKTLFGHTFGAAGALDAAVAALSLRDGVVPGLAESPELDPECELPFATGRRRALRSRAALVAGTGRGGINAALSLVAA